MGANACGDCTKEDDCAANDKCATLFIDSLRFPLIGFVASSETFPVELFVINRK
jgi:hypothetical protein